MAKAQEKAATRRLKGKFQGRTLKRSETSRPPYPGRYRTIMPNPDGPGFVPVDLPDDDPVRWGGPSVDGIL